MKLLGILDRHLLREWTKIFLATSVGFPLFVIVIDITDKLDEYLARGISTTDIVFSYVYSFPEKLWMVLPAAVLFATVFTIGTFSRNSELSAAKASGLSFYRTAAPILLASLGATAITMAVGEMAPPGTRKQMELLGEREVRSDARRFSFVYRAEEGWVYVVTSVDAGQRLLREVQLEREGTGEDYPTLVIQSPRAVYSDSLARWTLSNGRFRVVTGNRPESTFEFDSLRLRSLRETPEDLLAEPKRPEEMVYAELGRYIEALERSGGDGSKLSVSRELKIAIPFTCVVIAIFSAPLAVTAPRTSGAVGIGIGLGTTVIFMILVQLSQAIGISGLLPPVWAAWLPNMAFGLAGLLLMIRTRT